MKNLIHGLLILIMILSFFTVSCDTNQGDSETSGETDTSSGDGETEGTENGPYQLNVSVKESVPAARSVTATSRSTIIDIIDDSLFKASLNNSTRGELLKSFTPVEFILDIDALGIYISDSNSGNPIITNILEFVTQPGGAIIPRHINIIKDEDFIRELTAPMPEYTGMAIQFMSGMSTSNDGHYVLSFIGVDLGPDYDGITLLNELNLTTWETTLGMDLNSDSAIHYFNFNTLNPFDEDIQVLYIGSDISTPGLVSSSDSDVTDLSYFRSTAVAFRPSANSIVLSNFENPELQFNWDMENLIEVYNNGTLDLNDDIVTFNLSDPFPVSLTVAENNTIVQNGSTSDATAPTEVLYPAISGKTTYNTIQWLNPTDNDFEKVIITRKIDSEPTDINDGDTVYESYTPNYCDETGTSGVHYYYKIFTKDYSGNSSLGIVLDQIQK